MDLISKSLSVIWDAKFWILGAGLAVGVGFGAYHLINKVETLSGELANATTKIENLEKSIKDIKTESALRERAMNTYQKVLNANQTALDKKVAQLDKAAKREKIVAAKPGLVTKIAKKQYNAFEREYACLTGNLEFCSPQQSSQDVQEKK